MSKYCGLTHPVRDFHENRFLDETKSNGDQRCYHDHHQDLINLDDQQT